MNRSKGNKADCRADTRGGPWAGIPKCLIDSAAYRALSLHARAVLIEIVARMNGYNNGSIAVSHRELVDALGCSPNRIVKAIGELVQHAMLDVAVEGTWKARQARQYRLTFVSTKSAPATNEYLRWTPTEKKAGATGVIAKGIKSATDVVAVRPIAATGVIARLLGHPRKSAIPEISAATDVVALIDIPYTPASVVRPVGENGHDLNSPSAGGVRCDTGTGGHRTCERCGDEYALVKVVRGLPRRFCSERCRTNAERARSNARRKLADTTAARS